MQTFSIEDKIFKTMPLFILNCTEDEAYDWLKKKYDDHELIIEEGCDGTMHTFDTAPHRVIWIKEFKKDDPEDLGVIVHELSHLVVRICEDKGVPILAYHEGGQIGDETFAYLIDFFFVEFLKKVK